MAFPSAILHPILSPKYYNLLSSYEKRRNIVFELFDFESDLFNDILTSRERS